MVVFFACSGRGYKDTAIDFVESLHEADAKKMLSLMSDDLIYELMEVRDAGTEKVLKNQLEKLLESNVESLKSIYGKKWKYEIEFIDAVQEEDLCIVVIDVTYKGKTLFSKKENTSTVEIELIKDGRNWYVDAFPDL